MDRAPSVIATLAIGSLLAGPARAADTGPANRGLETVTVIGITPHGTSQPLADVAAAAQGAGSEDIERSHAADLTAFLNRRFSGMYVNENQGNPLQPDVSYRGFTASPLLGTPQGLAVFLDGVRINQPFGDVVSWDLIPRAAIERVDLVSGADPLFGVNSLGGSLALRTKDGYSAAGTTLSTVFGSHERRQLEAETGGHTDHGFYWYATANRFRDDGWRDASPTDAKQALAKLGHRTAATDVSLTVAGAESDLTGNGLQELRLLQNDYESVYTKPDETHNRSVLLNLQLTHRMDAGLTLSGNAWHRNIRTSTYNGDVNEAALGESLYQPSAAERAALAAAGYAGFPASGETQANTPFPKWRCIANALLNDEPNEKCNGLINRTALSQHETGLALQLQWDRDLLGRANLLTAGVAGADSRAHFRQSSQFAYLTSDRGVMGVTGAGAFADGSQASENAFDSRVDLTGRMRTASVYLADSFAATPLLRVNLAVRYDHSHVASRDALTPGGGAGSLDGEHRFGRLNPAAGTVLAIGRTASLFAGYSQTSRAPSAIELGCADATNPCRLPNAMAGDPPLDQVVTHTWEFGLRARPVEPVQWSATLFRAESADDILFVADDQAGFGYFRNFGRTRRQGIELGGTAHVADWTFGMNYTYVDATYRTAETLNGDASSSNGGAAPGFEGDIEIERGDHLPLIPRHIAKAFVQWQALPSLSLDADASYVGRSPARGNENGRHQPDGVYYLGPGYSAGYVLLNLGAEWRPMPRLATYLQVNNVLDRRYATAAQLGATPFTAAGDFQARPFASPVIDGERPLVSSTFYAPGAPRAFLLGVRYRLGP